MARPFRLYVCSDIHASERAWRKFLNAMKTNVYKVDAAVIAGDLTGKALIAVVRGERGGEEWTATPGGGARLNGEPLVGPGPKEKVELLSFEATRTDLIAETIGVFTGLAERTRVMGSLALSLCHLAAGRFDAVISLKPVRSVDIAAAQLLVRERGFAIDLPEDPPFGRALLDVRGRSRVVAARTPERCAELFAALSSALPGERSRRP